MKMSSAIKTRQQNANTILQHSLSPNKLRSESHGWSRLNCALPSGSGKCGFALGVSLPNPAGSCLAILSGNSSIDNLIFPPPFAFKSIQNSSSSFRVSIHRFSVLYFSQYLKNGCRGITASEILSLGLKKSLSQICTFKLGYSDSDRFGSATGNFIRQLNEPQPFWERKCRSVCCRCSSSATLLMSSPVIYKSFIDVVSSMIGQSLHSHTTTRSSNGICGGG